MATPEEKTAFAQVSAEVLELPSAEGWVDLEKLLKALGEREITSVLVEGGGILLGSLFDCGLVDKVTAFIAPIIIGGKEAKTAVSGEGVGKVVDSLRLERIRVEKFGEDLMVSGYVATKREAECSPAL
jgi:diaminohydroxyphosphoribosylaminopyrimidine deaminase/5-amino-6-(5-phosphoribosylamino)uracil reductase